MMLAPAFRFLPKLRHKRRGRKSNKQGVDSETLVADKLKSNGWVVIRTKGSKSPIDLLAHHRRKKLWWGVQVKSSVAGMTFDVDALSDICSELHFTPVLAFVGISKRRLIGFCMQKASKLYHMSEDVVLCITRSAKIGSV